MKYCLQLSHHSWAKSASSSVIDRTFEAIKSADRAGFDSVWISEDPDGWDAFALLAAAARETEHIRLGTGVTNPFLRHPNLIAASVSTLDRISGGRAFLGLGRGQPEWYRESLGINVESPLEAIESTLSLLRQWWKSPFIAQGADPFPVRGWERSISPLSGAMPPIYLAAVGPRMLELAGRIADGVRFNEMASSHFLEQAIGAVRQSARATGRDPEKLAIFVHPSVTITDDPEKVLERKKGTIAMVHALPGMERQLETPGIDVHAIIEEVRQHMRTKEVLAGGGGFPQLRRAGDLAAARRAIPLELMEKVAVVGDVRYVKSRLTELAQLGATHVFLDLDGLSHDDESVDGIISRILPDSL